MAQFQLALDEAIGHLQESVAIMAYEEFGSYGHKIAMRARKNLTDLKEVRQFAEFLN